MVGKTFRRQVILTVAATLICNALLVWSGYRWSSDLEALKAAPAILIPISGAWLAFCWQRRNAFVKALFDIWQKVVITVQDALQYTLLPEHSQTDFAKVMHGLSCRIDDIRGAFRNVEEPLLEPSAHAKQFVLRVKKSGSLEQYHAALVEYNPHRIREVGLYPFESLKQMQNVVRQLGWGQGVTEERATIARNTLVALWQILRGELLKELDRDYPEYPDTPYRAKQQESW